MKTLSKIPHILNEIFKEFREASNITIEYKGYPAEPDDRDVTDFLILSVNGYKSPAEFSDYIRYLGAKLIQDAMKAQTELPSEEKTLFFEQLLKRFKPLIAVVIFEKFYTKASEWNSKAPTGRYHFNMAEFTGDIYHEAPYYHIDRIIHKAWKFSYAWRNNIHHFHQKLSQIATFIEFVPHLPVIPNQEEPVVRVPFRMTVDQVAALARFLYDNKAFDTANKSEVCRAFAKAFRTRNQDNISWTSFKNHFDAPSVDAILFWQAEFGNLMNKSLNLVKKYTP